MKYREQLRTTKWKKKKNSILKRDNYKCVKCGETTNLQVHHIYYVNDHKAWEYPNNALMTLCKECHEEWHDKHEIEVRKKIWCKKSDYKAPLQQKKTRSERKAKKKNKIFNLAANMGLDIKDKVVLDIIKNNNYSKASFLFKQLVNINSDDEYVK